MTWYQTLSQRMQGLHNNEQMKFSCCRHRGRFFGMVVALMLYFTIVIYIHGLATKHIASNDDDIHVFKADRAHKESFSACLLIMDDNHRLSEWIGYHYFAMSLRYLVVAVDPHSKTSPSLILNRWRNRMIVVEWTDSNFTDKLLIIGDNDDHQTKKGKHRTRQADFYLECTRHLQNNNRTWTSYHGKHIIFPWCISSSAAAAERRELVIHNCCSTHRVLSAI